MSQPNYGAVPDVSILKPPMTPSVGFGTTDGKVFEESGTYVVTDPVIGYKKVRCEQSRGPLGIIYDAIFSPTPSLYYASCIATLRIPTDAIITRNNKELRANMAELIHVEAMPSIWCEINSIGYMWSDRDHNYRYKLGQMHKPANPGKERSGIYFYEKRSNAVKY